MTLTVYAKYDYYSHHKLIINILSYKSRLGQEGVTVLTDPLLGVVAGDVVPNGLVLPEAGGEGEAGLLLPLQQLQPLLSVIRLWHRTGLGVCLLVDLRERHNMEQDQNFQSLITCVKMPVVPQGFADQPGGVVLVGGIILPEPDQNQLLMMRGWRLGSV